MVLSCIWINIVSMCDIGGCIRVLEFYTNEVQRTLFQMNNRSLTQPKINQNHNAYNCDTR